MGNSLNHSKTQDIKVQSIHEESSPTSMFDIIPQNRSLLNARRDSHHQSKVNSRVKMSSVSGGLGGHSFVSAPLSADEIEEFGL